MAQTVVILGGSFAGLHIAHALLKKQSKDLKVILVSKVSNLSPLAGKNAKNGDAVQDRPLSTPALGQHVQVTCRQTGC